MVLQLGLSFTFFETASASIRSGEILSAYIYLITKSNSFVGYVQGVNGILQARAILTSETACAASSCFAHTGVHGACMCYFRALLGIDDLLYSDINLEHAC